MTETPRRSLPEMGWPSVRRIALLILAACLAVIPALVVTAPAQAESTVSIDAISFEEEEFADGSKQQITVDWSIPEAAENPVTLGVDLPEGLQGFATEFPMVGPDGETAGNCVVTADRVDCTVDPAFIEANPIGVSGQFFFWVAIQLDNSETTEQTFDLGGATSTVTVKPRPSGSCTQDCEYPGTTAQKTGNYTDIPGADDEITWIVYIGSGPEGVEPGKTISVTDHLDLSKYELVEPPRVQKAGYVRYDARGFERPQYEFFTDGVTISPDGLTLTFESEAGRGADYSTPPTDPDSGSNAGQSRGTDGSFYRVFYKVRVIGDGEPQPDGSSIFRNDASYTIEGEESTDVSGDSRSNGGGGTVIGTNVGKVQVTKELSGDTTLNPSFTVNYTAFDGETEVPDLSGSFEVTAGNSWTSPDFPKGTRLVIDEVLPTDPSNVTWADPVLVDADGDPVTELTFSADNDNLGKLTLLTLKNRATLETGRFDAQKVIVNEDGVALPEDQTFTLDYSYPANDELGIPAGSGSLEIPASGEVRTSEDLPIGAELTFSETPATVAGGTWASPEISPSTLTIGAGSGTQAVTVTNTISADQGGFSLTKSVSGEGADLVPEGSTFEVTYSYPAGDGFEAGSGTVEVVAGAEPVSVDGLPEGAVVTLDEIRPMDPVGGTWGEPIFDQSTFTIVKDQTISVSLDNPITWDSGDFSVTKTVEGDAARSVPTDATFTVDYSYTLPEDLGGGTGEGQLTVRNDGEAVRGEALPYGTVVTFSEQAPAGVAGATWGEASFSPAQLTIGDGTTAGIALTNSISTDVGDLAVIKTISGDAADRVPADAVFVVDYSYPAGAGYDAGEGTVEVSADGEPTVITDLPFGAVVTFEEQAPVAIPGTAWGAPIYDDGSIRVVGEEAATLQIDNPITLLTGGFEVSKVLEGSGTSLVDGSTTFTVDYSYPAGDGFEAGSGQLEIPADGTPVSSGQLPAGAEVTLSEATPAPVDGATWRGSVFSQEGVTIEAGGIAEVTLTNTIDENPTDKPTDGPTDQPTDQPTVEPTDEPSDGPTVEPTDEPTDEPTAGPSGAPSTPAPSSAPDSDEQPTPDGGNLAQTGIDLGFLPWAALLLLGAGAGLLWKVRRR